MPGKFLDMNVEVSGSWRRLEKKYGEVELSKYLDQLIDDLTKMAKDGLRLEFDSASSSYNEYSGKLRRSIYSKRTGRRTAEVGLDLRAPGSRHHQSLYIYAMSQLKGWNTSPMSIKRIEDRLIPWVKKTFGYSGRQARAAAVGIVRRWVSQSRHPGENFVAKVLQIPPSGAGLEGVFVGEYYSRAKELHEEAYQRAKRELEMK